MSGRGTPSDFACDIWDLCVCVWNSRNARQMRYRVSRGSHQDSRCHIACTSGFSSAFLGHNNFGRHWLQFSHHGTSSHAFIHKHLFIQFSKEVWHVWIFLCTPKLRKLLIVWATVPPQVYFRMSLSETDWFNYNYTKAAG